MVIPLAESKSLFKSPNVATQKAVSEYNYIMGKAQMQMGAARSLENAVLDVEKVALMQARATEEQQLQDLYNNLMAKYNDEDLALQQRHNKDAVDYEPTYYENKRKAHAEFVNAIKGYPPELREKYRQTVNEQNLQRHSRAQAHIQRERENWEDDTLVATQDLNSKNASIGMVQGNLKNNKQTLEDNYIETANITREHFKNRGYDDTYINFQLQNLRNKFVVDAAEHLARNTGGLKDAVELIKSQEPYLNHKDFKELASHYENQYLNLMYAQDPNAFIKDGKYSDAYASKFAPDLTEEERRKRITDASSNGSSMSGFGLNAQMSNEQAWYDRFVRNNGVMPFNDYMTFEDNANVKFDADAIKNDIKSGKLKLGEMMNWITSGTIALNSVDEIAETGETINHVSPEFKKKWQNALNNFRQLVLENTGGKMTLSNLINSDKANGANVGATWLHDKFEDYRKQDIKLWVFGKKRQAYYLDEADAIQELFMKTDKVLTKDWSSWNALERDNYSQNVALVLAKYHPEYKNRFLGIPQGTEQYNQIFQNTVSQIKADFIREMDKAERGQAISSQTISGPVTVSWEPVNTKNLTLYPNVSQPFTDLLK